MRRGWGRWRGYMDELEVVMRQAAERLEEAEALIAEAWERGLWHKRQRESLENEVLRRALDMPFLGPLLEAARRRGGSGRLEPPDFIGRPWTEGEDRAELTPSLRFPPDPGSAAPAPGQGAAAPARRERGKERILLNPPGSQREKNDRADLPVNVKRTIRGSRIWRST